MFLVFVSQTDPGVPVVYAGFGALMLTTCISYLSHSQVTVTISIKHLVVYHFVPLAFIQLQPLMLFCVKHDMKIWALQNGTTLMVGGRTNRAKNEFPDDMNRLLDQVPELIETSVD